MSVSVIITSYNRFQYLLHSIESVKEQTYKPCQIIVINDGSTQSEYYTHNFDNVIVIHLSKNTKTIFGQSIPGGIQRNIGAMVATGKYIAFLDDDDVWLPKKLELQIEKMEKTGLKMSCTEGLLGSGVYVKTNMYPKYNSEHFDSILKGIFCNTLFLKDGIPDIITENLLKIHNCCICSSVVVEKEAFFKAGMFKKLSYADDYDLWLRIIQLTDCCYIREPCVYYDSKHGDGNLY